MLLLVLLCWVRCREHFLERVVEDGLEGGPDQLFVPVERLDER
jgi:hypothetical protein